MCDAASWSFVLHVFGPPVLGFLAGGLALVGLRAAGRARRAAAQAFDAARPLNGPLNGAHGAVPPEASRPV